MVKPLARALGPDAEVVLHDFQKLPNSIVAIEGNLTGRTVGGPITDLLLERVKTESASDILRYPTTSPDGRSLLSSTIFIRDQARRAVGCLCINLDTTAAKQLQSSLDRLLSPFDPMPVRSLASLRESFPTTVQQLTVESVKAAIGKVGVPVALMQKVHKLAVVKDLEQRGVFLIRDAVNYVAGELQVTRYTIYNYLNEISPDQQTAPAPTPRYRQAGNSLPTVSHAPGSVLVHPG